jgi:hypothetical protein
MHALASRYLTQNFAVYFSVQAIWEKCLALENPTNQPLVRLAAGTYCPPRGQNLVHFRRLVEELFALLRKPNSMFSNVYHSLASYSLGLPYNYRANAPLA